MLWPKCGKVINIMRSGQDTQLMIYRTMMSCMYGFLWNSSQIKSNMETAEALTECWVALCTCRRERNTTGRSASKIGNVEQGIERKSVSFSIQVKKWWSWDIIHWSVISSYCTFTRNRLQQLISESIIIRDSTAYPGMVKENLKKYLQIYADGPQTGKLGSAFYIPDLEIVKLKRLSEEV